MRLPSVSSSQSWQILQNITFLPYLIYLPYEQNIQMFMSKYPNLSSILFTVPSKVISFYFNRESANSCAVLPKILMTLSQVNKITCCIMVLANQRATRKGPPCCHASWTNCSARGECRDCLRSAICYFNRAVNHNYLEILFSLNILLRASGIINLCKSQWR